MRHSRYPKDEYERLIALNDGLPLLHQQGKRNRFLQQMEAARRRGIPWEFTFEQWVAVWNESGKWDQRGTSSGQYVMGRHGDIGPYSAVNVAIVTNEQNIREGVLKRPKPFGNTSRLGTGKGVSRRSEPIYAKRPWVARFRKKHLGYFASEEEARAVYLAALDGFLISRSPTTDSAYPAIAGLLSG